MSDHRNSISEVAQSVFKLISGTITDDEFAQFQEVLIHDEIARKHYYELMYVSVALKNTEGIQSLEETFIFDMDLWREMAVHENTSSGIEIPQQKPQRELIRKVAYPRNKRKISKFTVGFLAMNAAAMLFFFLFLKFAPPKTGIEVATLTDSINAKWIGVKEEMSNGTRMTTSNEGLFLSEGCVEMLFYNQAKIIIEGPAEFRILTDDQIKLSYGRLYAVIPSKAIGFTIKTPSTQVIDLGTEFGVQADFQGDTSLHVMKGKTILIAGDQRHKKSIEVEAGIAKGVSAATQTVFSIPCNDRLFVRKIDSAKELAWRGETEISLADLSAGGNGFGTGLSTCRINCKKNPAGLYVPINANPVIDCVFVPSQKEGAPVISSTGLIFHECPETSGDHLLDFNYGTVPFGIRTMDSFDEMSNKPALFMHANAGITFDLESLRASYPEFSITGFTSQFGIKDNPEAAAVSKADLWILVDGQLAYSVKGVMQGQVNDIYVPLARSSRYLTLVVTEAAYDEDMDAWFNRYILGDLCVFGNPSLNITEIEND